jgi:hypothetical protein
MNTKHKTKKSSPPPKKADEALAIVILLMFKHLAETGVLTYEDASELLRDLVEELPPVSEKAVGRINQILITLFLLRI